jgi:hypothetical protein
MTDQERGFAPTDPSDEDDRLAREPRERAPQSEEPDESVDQVEGEPEKEPEETEKDARPRSPQRQLLLVGWAAVAVLLVVGALMAVELVRITNAVNNNGCILRAQATFLEAQGPGVSPGFAGLDRLAAQNQLKLCSR